MARIQANQFRRDRIAAKIDLTETLVEEAKYAVKKKTSRDLSKLHAIVRDRVVICSESVPTYGAIGTGLVAGSVLIKTLCPMIDRSTHRWQ